MIHRLCTAIFSLLFLHSLTTFANPAVPLSRFPEPVDVLDTLRTNAQRLAAGYSPLPPVKRWTPSRVAAARRSGPSSSPTGGQIQITTSTGSILGYLSDGLTRGFYTIAPTLGTAGIFTSANHLLHRATASTESPYVTALIVVNRNILVADTVNGILGDSAATDYGAPPQPNNDIIFSGYNIESAIWTPDASSGGITAELVDDNSQSLPATIISYNDFLYLTPDPATVLDRYPSARVVTFTLL